jgi:hypothetical protein
VVNLNSKIVTDTVVDGCETEVETLNPFREGEATVVVTILDVNDFAPETSVDTVTATISENLAVNRMVVAVTFGARFSPWILPC